MSLRPSHVRFYATAWRRKTLAMPLEAEGLLIRISAFNMESGVALPPDRTTAARMLGVHRNKLDKVLAVLIDAGEIVEDETGIFSQRAIDEYSTSQRQVNPRATSRQPHRNPDATPGVEAKKTQQKLRAIVEKRREDIPLPPDGAMIWPKFEQLSTPTTELPRNANSLWLKSSRRTASARSKLG